MEGYAAALPFLSGESAEEVSLAIEDLEFERDRLSFHLAAGLDLETAQLATAVETQARANERREDERTAAAAAKRNERLFFLGIDDGLTVDAARRFAAGETVGGAGRRDDFRPEYLAQLDAEEAERQRQDDLARFEAQVGAQESRDRALYQERYGRGSGASSGRFYAGRQLSDIPPVTQNFDFRDSIIGLDNVQLFMRQAVEEVLREWGITAGAAA